MDTLNAKTQLSNLSTAQTPIFMLKPDGVVEMREAEFLEKYAAKLGWSVSKARFALDAYTEAVLEGLSNNKLIEAGPFRAKLAIRGSVAGMTSQPNKVDNPVVANITATGGLAEALRLITVLNVSEVVAAAIYEIQQTGCLEMSKIVNATGDVVITGSGLELQANAADEGVWLENKDTGVMVGSKFSVTSSDSAVIHCTPTGPLPTNGLYRLVIATRDGDATKSVRTVKRIVTVEAAQA